MARYAGSVPEMQSMLGMPGMRYIPLDSHTALAQWQFSPFPLLVLAAVVVTAAWYLRARSQLAARGRRWSWKRTRLLPRPDWWPLDVALQSPVATFTMEFFQAHVIQHLLLMVVAPPLLAMGAPMTLALQTSGRDDQGASPPDPQLPAVPVDDPPGAGGGSPTTSRCSPSS